MNESKSQRSTLNSQVSTRKSEQRRQDARELGALGYAQELFRTMGGFSNFAISFSIISILTGAVTLYSHGLVMGGPAEMAFGWPLVSLFTLAVALSMAELASSIPTSGAMYHWACRLGGTGWAGSRRGSTSSGSWRRLSAAVTDTLMRICGHLLGPWNTACRTAGAERSDAVSQP